MIQLHQTRLIELCSTVPGQLRVIEDIAFEAIDDGKWSKKQILGHLIDSATINLQRFVRSQLENGPQIWYDQDAWVAIQNYQDRDREELIACWEQLNRHIAHVISQISAENLQRTCTMKNGERLTLEFLIGDYIEHLEHHLGQI